MSEADLNSFDVVVIGAGAAGLFAAGFLSRSKIKTLVLEKNDRIAKKLIISGGGRCNFTNLYASHSNFQGKNKHFHKSALSQYSQNDFIEMMKAEKLNFYEKKLGQLFCQNRSKDLLDILLKRIDKNFCEIRCLCEIKNVDPTEGLFTVTSKQEEAFYSRYLVVATGGLSFPRVGVSDLGYRVGNQLGHDVSLLEPALVPLEFTQADKFFKELSGLSLPAQIECKNKKSYLDDLLFTHKGLSGPVVLKASLHWNEGDVLKVNFLPMGFDWSVSYQQLLSELKSILPKRFLMAIYRYLSIDLEKQELSKKERERLKVFLSSWQWKPLRTLGFDKAEVTRGGISTKHISSKTMESKKQKNLYFIGEVLDVTGELGGYNFQWAWSSAFVAAQDIINKKGESE